MTSPNGRGELAEGEEPVSDSGWVTTKRAVAALGVASRTIRDHIRSGKLTGRSEGEGVEKAWYLSIDSIYTLREERRQKARGGSSASAPTPSGHTDILREALLRLDYRAAEVGDLRARL